MASMTPCRLSVSPRAMSRTAASTRSWPWAAPSSNWFKIFGNEPPPVSEALGNGCHIHYSVWRGDKNLFGSGEGEIGIACEGESAVAGLLDRLHESCAIFAPSVPGQ